MSDPAFWSFVNTGKGGPTGRPVSMFTFALQAQCWPEQISCFKLFNIGLHVVNAALVFCFVYLFFRSPKSQTAVAGSNRQFFDALTEPQIFYLALFVSLIWALHPLHTSVVLYTIQRMAVLSNFFILFGVNCWLLFRLYGNGGSRWLAPLCLLAVLGSWVLGTFSKENGLLLVIYILVVDYCWGVLHSRPAYQQLKQWAILLFWLAVIIFPFIFTDYVNKQYELRHFTMIERLLTQSRLMFDYLYSVLQPSPVAGTVYSDVEVSTNLFQPISTLFSVLGLAAMVLAATVLRHSLPVLFLAVFWFLTSHVLESTYLALELYFIHRNYLRYCWPLIVNRFPCPTSHCFSTEA